MACILALDGFYMEGRNIRASYGTSKYCSAFIKNVRCNNPDCTYLHCMGDSEDTFTKQEIQAGYVTSGRDVMAKQQQLAAGSNSSRRRVGSGGPSGTGKVASNPVFPPPIYEEPSKPSQSNLVPPPPPATSSTTQFPPVSSASLQRSTTSTGIAGFSAVAAGSTPSLADVAKMSRSASVPLPSTNTKVDSSMTPAEMLSRQQEELRRKHPQNNANNVKKPASSGVALNQQSGSATAASIVAGVHSSNKVNSNTSSHTTLTALTPLKRATSLPEKKEQSKVISNTRNTSSSSQSSIKDEFITPPHSGDVSKLSDLRNDSKALDNDPMPSSHTNGSVFVPSTFPSAPGVGSIGGQPIGGSVRSSTCGPIGFGHQKSSTNSSIGGIIHTNNYTSREVPLGTVGSSGLGSTTNSVVGGDVIGGFDIVDNSKPIGGGSILPLANMRGPEKQSNGSDELFGKPQPGPLGGSGLWDQPMSNSLSSHASNNIPGTNRAVGGSISTSSNHNLSVNSISGTSALASMLGIELPTGVGSLRETLWASSTPLKSPSPETKPNTPAPIGSGVRKSTADRVIIGGQANAGSHGSVPIGGYGISSLSNSGGNKSDIALLQSLLPGVHITSGNAYRPAASHPNPGANNPFAASEWGNLGHTQQQKSAGVPMPNQQYARDSWNGSNFYSSGPGSSGPGYQNQNSTEKKNQGNIW